MAIAPRAGTIITLALALLALLVVPASSQRVERVRLELPPSSRAVFGPGSFRFGLGQRERERSVVLCRVLRGTPQDAFCGPARFEHEPIAREVSLDRFALERTEVSVAAWRECVRDGACSPTHRLGAVDDARLPVTHVRAAEAEGFCRWRGGRLPTEEEWERGARGRGADDRLFPWGMAYNDRLSNHGRAWRRVVRDIRAWSFVGEADPIDGFRRAAPVGSFPDGASPDGLLDMAGNVWEWTASVPDDLPDASLDSFRVVRGGSFASPPDTLRVTTRAWLPAAESFGDVGFRCAYDLD